MADKGASAWTAGPAFDAFAPWPDIPQIPFQSLIQLCSSPAVGRQGGGVLHYKSRHLALLKKLVILIHNT